MMKVSKFYVFGHLKLHPKTYAILTNAASRGIPMPNWKYIFIIDGVIRDFVSYGFWDKLDIFHFFAGLDRSTQEFKCINWIDPSKYHGYFWGNLTNAFFDYGLDGKQGGGANPNSAYFVSGKKYSEVGKFSLNDASVGTLVYKQAIGIVGDVSAYVGAGVREGVCLTPAGGNSQRLNAFIYGINVNFLGLGLMVLNRTSNVNVNGINKNVQTFGSTTSSSVVARPATALFMGNVKLTSNSYHTNAGVSCLFSGQNIPFEMSQLVRTTINEKYFRPLGLDEIA